MEYHIYFQYNKLSSFKRTFPFQQKKKIQTPRHLLKGKETNRREAYFFFFSFERSERNCAGMIGIGKSIEGGLIVRTATEGS